MKKLLLTILICFTAYVLSAQVKVPADSVAKYIGQNVTVCAWVYGVKSLDKLSFINLGAAYPKSPLTIVIFTKDLPNFKTTPEILFANKTICVTGKLEDFKGKPQIVITRPEEIIVQ
jgi:aspartyl/asparaginyl-tRNA synthetase